MDFTGFGFECVTEMCNSYESYIKRYSNGEYFDHGFHLQNMSNIGCAGLYENYSEPRTVESQTDQSPPISVCSENIVMGQQNSKIWMDMTENSRQLDWDDNNREIIGSNPSTKTYNSEGRVVRRQQGRQTSKNLNTERKRRKKMKEALYKLRSVVPNISKMDKQSIVVDAVSYVLDLQKKVQEIEDEIQALTSPCPNRADHSPVNAAETTKPLTNANFGSRKSADMKESVDKLINDGKILEVEICDMGEGGIYHVRINIKKEAVGLVQLMRALESLSLHIMNSNICRFDEAILCTLTLNERTMQTVGVAKLEVMIRQTIASASLV